MIVAHTDTPVGRRGLSTLFLTAGLCAVTVGYLALLVGSLVIDSSTTVDAATAALHDRDVRALLAERTADAVAAQLVGEHATKDLAAFGIDVRRDLAPVAGSLVSTAEFANAYAEAVQKLHDRIFVDPTIAPAIDVSALVARARNDATAINPAYGQLIPPDATLVVMLPTAALPDFSVLDRWLSATRGALAIAAGAGAIVVAFAVSPERWRTARRVAAWLLGLGGIQLALCLSAQAALTRLSGDSAPIVRAGGAAVLPQVASPALAPLFLGIGALATSLLMHRAVGRRLVADGRDAFLTDEHGRPTEWRFDAAFEPEMLRTAPGTATYQR